MANEITTATLESELRSDVRKLFNTLSGLELAQAVIERVHQDHVQDIHGKVKANLGKIRDELEWHVSSFITDVNRKDIVRAHAQGISTSDAVTELMLHDPPMYRLAQDDAMGWQGLRKALVPRLAYLKPGSVRWPEKKYGAVWREAREEHKRTVIDTPFTSKVEQRAILGKHVERTIRRLEKNSTDTKEYQQLTNSLIQTVKNMPELSTEEILVAENLFPPQLVALVVQQLTIALNSPEQMAIGGEAKELLEILQKLAPASKALEQKTEGNAAKALPAPADSDNENPND